MSLFVSPHLLFLFLFYHRRILRNMVLLSDILLRSTDDVNVLEKVRLDHQMVKKIAARNVHFN